MKDNNDQHNTRFDRHRISLLEHLKDNNVQYNNLLLENLKANKELNEQNNDRLDNHTNLLLDHINLICYFMQNNFST